jgi:hypothetical protein
MSCVLFNGGIADEMHGENRNSSSVGQAWMDDQTRTVDHAIAAKKAAGDAEL